MRDHCVKLCNNPKQKQTRFFFFKVKYVDLLMCKNWTALNKYGSNPGP
jgi:hypothetical protein